MTDIATIRGLSNVRPSRLKTNTPEYHAVHHWVYKNFGKPKKCEWCALDDSSRRYQWANLTGEYLKERADWARLCVPCHKKYDTRHENCPAGHSYEQFAYFNPRGQRTCRECNRLWQLARTARKKAAVLEQLTKEVGSDETIKTN